MKSMEAAGASGGSRKTIRRLWNRNSPLTKGEGTPIDFGNSLIYDLGTGEKGRLEIHIRFRGDSAHASVPWLGSNASYALAQGLQAIGRYEPELDTSLPFFDHLSEFAIEEQASPQNIDAIIEHAGARSPRLGSMLRALSRMTLTPTMIKGGIKSNSVPEVIELTCDVRTLPFQDEALRAVAAGHGSRGRRRRGLRDRLHGRPQLLPGRDRPVGGDKEVSGTQREKR